MEKGNLTHLKFVDIGLCKDCIYSGQKKVSFQKNGQDSYLKKLELVYTYV